MKKYFKDLRIVLLGKRPSSLVYEFVVWRPTKEEKPPKNKQILTYHQLDRVQISTYKYNKSLKCMMYMDILAGDASGYPEEVILFWAELPNGPAR